ncbi:5'-nucleotidase [Flavobacterium dauae]|uniref:5'-nucleotidase C-terminal domain-containing protein n=1 Tax=Flavobacterium dauae TaxID=1563479 RepID=UPI00101B22AD|nr:5'-nucleotidase [Flavobacterium dauae]WLD24407.1 5'-nucleotidase [Flavobacterium dauae]
MKYKNYSSVFIWCFTTFFMVSCGHKQYTNTKVDSAYIEVSDTVEANNEIDLFLKPYSDHITADLSKILAYNPQDLDKNNGKWQNPMTNFYADAILETAMPIFEQRTRKKIDFCLLNFGGIRATIAKGNITTRTAYDIMPFENSAVVLALKGNVVYEMADYFFKFKAAHPLSGIEIIADKNDFSVKDIKINHQSIDKNATYYVVTNDYLAKGGDRMDFFLKATESHSLDYKLRNMFIAYFTKIDTLKPSVQQRIIFE